MNLKNNVSKIKVFDGKYALNNCTLCIKGPKPEQTDHFVHLDTTC